MSEVAALTLSEFLLARIAEDEAEVRYILDNDYSEYAAEWSCPASATVDFGDDTALIGDQILAHHIVRYDPARVLAEVAAKRAIVEECAGWDPELDQTGVVAAKVLLALAAVYADHDDYRQEWKP